MRLKNKVAIITGGNSGIGKATAILFAKQGAKVVIGARNEKTGIEVTNLIKKQGGKAFFIKTDVFLEKDIKNLIDKTIKKFKKIDILFNNAGIELQKSIIDTTEKEWNDVLNINLRGEFFGCKHVIPHMIKNKKGSIINTSSVAGLVGFPNLTAYCASKGGVVMLTKQIAVDYAKYNIRVNAICPGAINTPMIKRFFLKAPNPKLAEKQMKEMHPMKRLGKPEEIANTALFLASDESSFITGNAIQVDGGITAQ